MRLSRVLLLLPLLAGSTSASASPILDFASKSVGGTVTSLGTSTTLGAVTASAYYLNAGTWTSTTLIARNETQDHGLGVCSPGEDCNIGGTGSGDANELSQLDNNEAILFSLAAGYDWTQLWVSSLDSGGTGGTEEGRVYWGTSASLATLLASSNHFDFKFGDFGSAVEGNLLGLSAASLFDSTARYVLFVPNGTLGENNDYLVWGASVRQPELDTPPVPEPATLTLLGLGLGAARLVRRRRKA